MSEIDAEKDATAGCVICGAEVLPEDSGLCDAHKYDEQPRITADERAAKREAAIRGMVGKGYSRERAEELIGLVAGAVFAPGKRFGTRVTPPAPTADQEADA